MKLRRMSTRDAGFDAALAALTRYEASQDAKIEATAREIVAAVRARGDEAVLEFTRRLDRFEAASFAELEVPRAALGAAPSVSICAHAPAAASAEISANGRKIR